MGVHVSCNPGALIYVNGIADARQHGFSAAVAPALRDAIGFAHSPANAAEHGPSFQSGQLN